MNTKLLMTASAITLGLAGVVLSFLPKEILGYLNPGSSALTDVLTLQIVGACYFAFAMGNWVAKSNLIGGIYGRPIAMGNLTHFAMGSFALVKGFLTSHLTILLVMALVYTLFAICFAVVVFSHPVKTN